MMPAYAPAVPERAVHQSRNEAGAEQQYEFGRHR
jgi:hypothetical protein